LSPFLFLKPGLFQPLRWLACQPDFLISTPSPYFPFRANVLHFPSGISFVLSNQNAEGLFATRNILIQTKEKVTFSFFTKTKRGDKSPATRHIAAIKKPAANNCAPA
jgi:hypothetical protein